MPSTENNQAEKPRASGSNALLAVPSRQGSAGSMLMPQAYNSLILEQRLVFIVSQKHTFYSNINLFFKIIQSRHYRVFSL